MNEKVLSAYTAFITNPSRETYLTALGEVTDSPFYNPYSDDISRLERLYEEQKFDEVVRGAVHILEGYLLSPRIHIMLDLALKKLGDKRNAEIECAEARLCYQGILSTGDGTASAPYVVTCPSDEQDILMYLGKKTRTQSLVPLDGSICDVFACEDGTELWFDITIPHMMFRARSI